MKGRASPIRRQKSEILSPTLQCQPSTAPSHLQLLCSRHGHRPSSALHLQLLPPLWGRFGHASVAVDCALPHVAPPPTHPTLNSPPLPAACNPFIPHGSSQLSHHTKFHGGTRAEHWLFKVTLVWTLCVERACFVTTASWTGWEITMW